MATSLKKKASLSSIKSYRSRSVKIDSFRSTREERVYDTYHLRPSIIIKSGWTITNTKNDHDFIVYFPGKGDTGWVENKDRVPLATIESKMFSTFTGSYYIYLNDINHSEPFAKLKLVSPLSSPLKTHYRIKILGEDLNSMVSYEWELISSDAWQLTRIGEIKKVIATCDFKNSNLDQDTYHPRVVKFYYRLANPLLRIFLLAISHAQL